MSINRLWIKYNMTNTKSKYNIGDLGNEMK